MLPIVAGRPRLAFPSKSFFVGVVVLYSTPFNISMTPLEGSSKLNGSPQKVMSKSLMTPLLPTTKLIPFFFTQL